MATEYYSTPEWAMSSFSEVDARVKGGLMVVCEFKGQPESPDKLRKCKFYQPSQHRHCCLHYRDEIDVGICTKE